MVNDGSDAEAMLALADLLRRAPRVVKLAGRTEGGGVDEIAAEAAASLMDIGRSADLVASMLLPRLRGLQPESRAFEEVLDDIAEEYRHINYHIVNTRLFNYVVPRE